MTALATFDLPAGRFLLRKAEAPDLPELIALLASDQLGAVRDGFATAEDIEAYQRAFAMIENDPGQLLVVAVGADDEVAATLQLSVIPGLSRRGALRAQIESVRVDPQLRGAGLGTQLLRWTIEEARRRGCALVQLTTDKTRPDAIRLYMRLGFTPSHEGMKLPL